MALPFAQSSFPEIYEQVLVGPLFRPFAEPLIEDLGLRAGEDLLDVACGTGIVARLAKERLGETGRVVGVDVSPLMLEVARRVAPDIEWREGDAGALPLRDREQFDVVVSQQGLQFFPDRPAAIRQLRRALRPGGRVAVSTWRPDEELPVLRELRRVAERHVGAIVDRRHGFGEAGPVEDLLREAGFREVRSKTLSRTIRFRDGSLFVRLNAMALVGMSAGAGAMDEQDKERIVTAIVHDSADTVRAHSGEAGFGYEISSNVTTARA